jgi:hypothetical protein
MVPHFFRGDRMMRSIRMGMAFAASALAMAAAPLRAQRELPPAERMLKVFVDDAEQNRTGGTDGIVAVQYAVTHPAQVAPAKLDSVLAGLEQLAVTSDVRLARIRSVMQIARLEDSTAFDRLVRIYRASAAHPEVRDMIMSSIEKPKIQRQVNEWIGLLRGIVAEPADAEDFPQAPFEAMRQLYALGEPGIAALRELHARGAARNPEVRALLASWARQNFKLQESAPGA